jgi:glycosyltransferase involved in cell wall biosynthesis
MTLISVILCSFNGAATLPQTLAAMARLVIDGFAVEVILVDNASQDETMAILRRAELPGVTRVLGETRPGKSHALNSGLAAATGDLVVFTDDDVLPAPGWLAAFHRAAQDHPEVVAFAGQVRPEWQAPPPHWLAALADLGRAFGATPTRFNDKVQPAPFWVFKGANMMIRRSALAAAPFDTGAANYGPGTIGGEDSGLVKQLLDAGQQALFVPEALIRHLVRPEQIGLRPFWQREVRIGRVMAAGPDFPREQFAPWVLGQSLEGWRRAAGLVMRAMHSAVTGRTPRAARALADLARLRGQLRQLALLAHSAGIDRERGG